MEIKNNKRILKDMMSFTISVVVPFIYFALIIFYSGILKKIFGK